jgi:hypothetical protein
MSPCAGSRPTTGSPPPPGPAPTRPAPTQPPFTTPCWMTTPRPSRSRRTWAYPRATYGQVLRRHPLPRPRRPIRCTLIPAPEPAARPPGPAARRDLPRPGLAPPEYLTWHRSLDDIAARVAAASRPSAGSAGIPVRGSSIYVPCASAPGIHPRDLPELLRSALIDPRALGRLDRLLFIAGHPSITAAAQALGLWHSALHHHVVLLERASVGPLVNRSPRPAGTTVLTPLGEQLCQQAHEYLCLSPEPGTP